MRIYIVNDKSRINNLVLKHEYNLHGSRWDWKIGNHFSFDGKVREFLMIWKN